MLTKKIVADGLTKALLATNHETFVRITGIKDQTALFASIKREEELKDALLKNKIGSENSKRYRHGVAAT